MQSSASLEVPSMTQNETKSLIDFCDAQLLLRKSKEENSAALKQLRQNKSAHMSELLNMMTSKQLECISLPSEDGRSVDDAGSQYVRIATAYNTRTLTPSFIRCTIHENYDAILELVASASESGEDDSTVIVAVVDLVLKILKTNRTKAHPVVVFSDKKPRHIKAEAITAISGELETATEKYRESKSSYESMVAEQKVVTAEIQSRVARTLPAVEQYMEKNDQKSQAIVLSKNNNMKMFLRRKVVLQRQPIKVDTLREVALSVIGRFRPHELHSRKDELIEELISQLVEQRQVVKRDVIKLDRSRKGKAMGSTD